MRVFTNIYRLIMVIALVCIIPLPGSIYEGLGPVKVVEAKEYGPHRWEAVYSQDMSYIEAMQELLSNDAYYRQELLGFEVCDLTFYSYSEFKEVSPPEWFVESVKDYSCDDRKILSRVAHYESRYDVNSVNKDNIYARGLYHVLPTTRQECVRIWGVGDEQNCALKVMRTYPEWYLLSYREYGLDRSFTDLLNS